MWRKSKLKARLLCFRSSCSLFALQKSSDSLAAYKSDCVYNKLQISAETDRSFSHPYDTWPLVCNFVPIQALLLYSSSFYDADSNWTSKINDNINDKIYL